MGADKYKVFVKVAELKNFTKAANELGYTQSAVSHIIKNFEEDLGLTLIKRSKSGIELTSIGKMLFPDIKSIVTYESSILQKASMLSAKRAGRINIGSFSSTSMQWTPSIIEGLRKDYPNIEVCQTHSTYKGIETMLKNGQIDCGFLTAMHKEDFNFIPLFEDEYCVVLPPEHRLTNYERIPIEALNGEDFIMMYEGSSEYDTGAIISEIDVRITHSVEDDFTAIPLIEKSLGFGILPRLLLDCVNTDAVIKSFAVPRYRTIGLAVRNNEALNPITKIFINYTRQFVNEYKEGHLDNSKYILT